MSFPANRRFQFYAQYWPFRWPLLGVFVIALGVYLFLKEQSGAENYAADVLLLLGKMAAVLGILFVLLSILMVCLAVLFFLPNKKKVVASWANQQLLITQLVQPLLGFVRVHLLYQQTVCSDSLLLLPATNSGVIFLKGTMASSMLRPSDVVCAEPIDGMLLHFEDPFRLFVFTFYIPIQLERLRLPDAVEESSHWKLLLHPDRDEQHTQTMQRRPSDWFKIKSFEAGDDVRRIVWRLYAKHNELMVRQQDEQHPYGDTLRVLTLFDTRWEMEEYPMLSMYLETKYKQRVFSLMNGLLGEGALLDWRTGTSHWINNVTSNSLGEGLSRSTWVAANAIKLQEISPMPSIVFISTIVDDATLSSLASQWPTSLFVLIDVFDELKHRSFSERLKGLFLKPSWALHTPLLDTWWRHPLRRRMLENKTLLQKTLSSSTKDGGVYV